MKLLLLAFFFPAVLASCVLAGLNTSFLQSCSFYAGILLAGVLAGWMLSSKSSIALPIALSSAFLALWFLSTLNYFLQLVLVEAYGDVDMIPWFIGRGEIPPKYHLGVYLLSRFADLLGPARETVTDSTAFLRFCTHMATLGGAGVGVTFLLAAVWKHWKTEPLLMIPSVLAPVSTLFCSAYPEYYSFVFGPWVLLILHLLSRSVADWRPLGTGIACGLLVALYFPMVFTATSIIVTFVAFRPHQGLLAGFSALVTFAIILVFTLQGGMTTFLEFLHQLLASDSNLKAFLPIGEALSPKLLAGRFYLLVYSGSSLTAAIIFVLLWRRSPSGIRVDARNLLLALLGGSHLFLFLFMDPKLGVRQDFDLYWPFYLTLSLVTGWLLHTRIGSRIHNGVLLFPKIAASACMGVALVHLFVLRFSGLPPAP